jgi:hypothetical protein
MELSRHLSEGKSSEFYTQTRTHIIELEKHRIPRIKRFREDAEHNPFIALSFCD